MRPALREPADPLHAAGARGRVRADSGRLDQGVRRARVGARRGRAALLPPRSRGARRVAAAERPRRAAGARPGAPGRSSTSSSAIGVATGLCRAGGLAWLLGRPGGQLARDRARTEEQLADNLAAPTSRSPTRITRRLEEIGRTAPVPVLASGSQSAARPAIADLALPRPISARNQVTLGGFSRLPLAFGGIIGEHGTRRTSSSEARMKCGIITIGALGLVLLRRRGRPAQRLEGAAKDAAGSLNGDQADAPSRARPRTSQTACAARRTAPSRDHDRRWRHSRRRPAGRSSAALLSSDGGLARARSSRHGDDGSLARSRARR